MTLSILYGTNELTYKELCNLKKNVILVAWIELCEGHVFVWIWSSAINTLSALWILMAWSFSTMVISNHNADYAPMHFQLFMGSVPIFCLLLGVSSNYAQPITGQAQSELTPSKGQKTDPGFLISLTLPLGWAWQGSARRRHHMHGRPHHGPHWPHAWPHAWPHGAHHGMRVPHIGPTSWPHWHWHRHWHWHGNGRRHSGMFWRNHHWGRGRRVHLHGDRGCWPERDEQKNRVEYDWHRNKSYKEAIFVSNE